MNEIVLDNNIMKAFEPVDQNVRKLKTEVHKDLFYNLLYDVNYTIYLHNDGFYCKLTNCKLSFKECKKRYLDNEKTSICYTIEFHCEAKYKKYSETEWNSLMRSRKIEKIIN